MHRNSLALLLALVSSTTFAADLRIDPTFTEVRQPAAQEQTFPAAQWRWIQPSSFSVGGGTPVTPGGSGGGGNNWSSEASLNSSLSAGQLLDAYSAQLKAADWTLLTRTESGKTLTSVWQFQDLDKQPQTGILTLRDDGQELFSAQLISVGFRS